MPRCARSECRAWRPELLIRLGGLGLRLDDDWYCSARCLEMAARQRLARTPATPATLPAVAQPRLGGLLANQNRIPAVVVEQALSEQAQTGLRLGTQLVKLGVVSTLDVLRALAAQGGVGFLTAVDSARLRPAPGNLSLDAVQSLRLVPFEADPDRQILKVACTAPVPRHSIGALRQLTGWIIEPYLVADEQWPALVHAYGAGRTQEPPRCASVADITAAAARVAAAARNAGGIRMSEARCDDCLWVRLESPAGAEELWLSATPASLGEAKEVGRDTSDAEAPTLPPAPASPVANDAPARHKARARTVPRPAGRDEARRRRTKSDRRVTHDTESRPKAATGKGRQRPSRPSASDRPASAAAVTTPQAATAAPDPSQFSVPLIDGTADEADFVRLDAWDSHPRPAAGR